MSRYRIRYFGGKCYPQRRGWLFWRNLSDTRNWAGGGYACDTRAEALDRIDEDKRQRPDRPFYEKLA